LSLKNAIVGLGLEKNILFKLFFFNVGLVEPVRFGSVLLISDFENQNRAKTKLFCDVFNRLIQFFLFGLFGLINCLVFLLTPNLCCF